jgi:hypothetical protein
MDAVLGYVSKQAMNYALRSGFILTTSYVLKQGNKLISSAPKSTARDELQTLQQRLSHKVRIISPAIDMIELIAARGNTSLESAINLTKELRQEIHIIGQRFAQTVVLTQKALSPQATKQVKADSELQMKVMCTELKKLLARIEDAVPLINLAITTSGVTLSTSLPQTVSPSRLLQASTLLVTGDSQYTANPNKAVQIGPTFTLSVYMLFAGHNRPQTEEEIRETTWKEIIHKARVKLRRVPLDLVTKTGSGSAATQSHHIKSASMAPSEADIPAEARADEFAYQLMIVEDLDDDRVHEHEEDQPQPGSFDDIDLAGIREMIPVHEISKIFYADTSKVLNIGMDVEGNHPVLLLKRDLNAMPPRRMVEREAEDSYIINGDAADDDDTDSHNHIVEDQPPRNEDPWRLPPSLDPEWIAFEVYIEDPDSDSDNDLPDDDETKIKPSPSLDRSLANLRISSPSPSPSPSPTRTNGTLQPTPQHLQTAPSLPINITTSLSLLELLLRLTSLQQFQQSSHLSITDELLNFFLEESASTGAGGDERRRQELRGEARRRVGWDVYDESPVKRRGESYQYRSPEGGWDGEGGGEGWRGTPGYESGRGGGGNGGRWSSPGPMPSRGMGSRESDIGGVKGLYRERLRVTTPRSPASPSPNVGMQQQLNQQLSGEDGVGNKPVVAVKGDKETPLRPSTGRSDEGLGTSPASATHDTTPTADALPPTPASVPSLTSAATEAATPTPSLSYASTKPKASRAASDRQSFGYSTVGGQAHHAYGEGDKRHQVPCPKHVGRPGVSQDVRDALRAGRRDER